MYNCSTSRLKKLACTAIVVALINVSACASKPPVAPPTCPPPPIQSVTIDPAAVGQKYLVYLMPAPSGGYTVCGKLPVGFQIAVVNGQLWLESTATVTTAAVGTYNFQIVTQ
jgi:hypothetical protein